jgi:hypothetical protein
MMDGRLEGSTECEGRRNVARHKEQDQKTIDLIANVRRPVGVVPFVQ